MAKKRDETAQRIIAAIKESRGVLVNAAKIAGVSYSTVWQYTQDYAEVKQAVHEAKECLCDMAESKLYDAMERGEAWAICFFLKTQGKHRGYSERREVTGENGGPITINVVEDK